MSAAPRKVVVEIELNADNRARVQVGARTLYHYWAPLQAHYRRVLLAPQRRTNGTHVGWQWMQAENAGLPTAEELRALRRRLSDAHRELVEAWAEGGPGGALTSEDAEVLRNRLGRLVANLVSLPDRELLGYVAQTTEGLAFHSWGAETPGTPVFPDESVLSIRGRVRQGEAPVPGATLSLESEEGAVLDQARSDAAGYYGFYQLKAGFYRVKASSPRAAFAPEGVSVELSGSPRDDVDLEAEDPAPKVDVLDGSTPAHRPAGTASAGGSRRGLGILAALLLLLGAGAGAWWFLGRGGGPAAPAPGTRAGGWAGGTGDRPGPSPAAEETRARRERRSDDLDTKVGAPRARGQVELDGEGLYAAFERAEHLSGAPASDGDAVTGEPSPESGLPGPEAQPDQVTGQLGKSPRAPGGAPGSVGAGTGGGGGSAVVKPGAKVRPVEAVPGHPETKAAAPASAQTKSERTPRPSGGPSPAPRPSGAPTPKAAPASEPASPTGSAKGASGTQGAHTAPDAAAASASPVPTPLGTPPPAGAKAKAEGAEPAAPSTQGPTPTPTAPGRSAPAVLAAAPGEPEARWLPPLRLQVSLWRVRYFHDAIVPTEPQPGPVDLAAARDLRDRAWRARQENQPTWVRSPRLLGGVVVRLPARVARQGLRWEGSTNMPTARLNVLGTRAEAGWYGGAPGQSGTLTLVDGLGAVWVRLRFLASGEISLQSREGVVPAYWTAMEARAGQAAPDWSGWRWLVDEGAPPPEDWLASEPGEGASRRLEVPLAVAREAGRLRIRWMDTATSWGVAGEVAVGGGEAATP